MLTITSRENPAVRDFTRLCASAGYRRSTGRFALEGARLTQDALDSGVRVERAFLTPEAAERHADLRDALERAGATTCGVPDALAEKMADTRSTQGILCTAFMLDNRVELDKIDMYGVYAGLENLQDPGNLGTVLRTAEALGVTGVVLSRGCADVYSPKVVRAAMGAVFRVPFVYAPDFTDALARLRAQGLKAYAAVADPSAGDIRKAELTGGVVAVIGNEGRGLTPEAVGACDARVTVPMRGRAESLNAAAAASIVLWEFFRGR